MNYNQIRGKIRKKLIAKHFAPRFGGKPNEWADSNHLAVHKEIEHYQFQILNNPYGSYKEFRDQYDILWIMTMFEFMKSKSPPFEVSGLLAQEAIKWITPQVNAAFPGIPDTIRKLSKPFVNHTTSNGRSD